jgi:hypothetical protein
MAHTTQRSMGERLRDVAEQLLDLAERADTTQRDLSGRRQLHDDIEATAGDVRAIVRGRAFNG